MAYSPAGLTTQTGTLAHLATVYYEKRPLDRLEAMFRFFHACEPHPIPQNIGKTIQMFRVTLPGFNTNPSAEGVIGTPVSMTTTTVSATIEQYSDFESSSQLLDLTDIQPPVTRMVDDLSYRASGSVDTIIRTEIDGNTSALVNTIGAALSAADFRKNVVLLAGINVRPKAGNEWLGVIHPYVRYDIVSDNTAGGFIDALKYQSGREVLNGEVGMVGGVRLLETTNVGTTGSAPNVQYYSYIFGEGGVGIVDLTGKGPDHVEDPRNQKFRIVVTNPGPSAADPVGEIKTLASYWFSFAAKTLDTTNLRFKIIKADASII